MPKSYSGDLRERVIEAVEGGASRRETAERFEVSVSSAVKWLQRWHESKSAAARPRGGSISPLEEFAEQILDLIAQQPDLTLVETVAELRKRRIRTSRSSLWRFLDRHGITLKKKPASCRTAASGFATPAGPHEGDVDLALLQSSWRPRSWSLPPPRMPPLRRLPRSSVSSRCRSRRVSGPLP